MTSVGRSQPKHQFGLQHDESSDSRWQAAAAEHPAATTSSSIPMHIPDHRASRLSQAVNHPTLLTQHPRALLYKTGTRATLFSFSSDSIIKKFTLSDDRIVIVKKTRRMSNGHSEAERFGCQVCGIYTE